MTKIVILGDLHAGCRNSNKIVEHWQERFFNELFFPYLKEHNISRVIQLGDVYDNRRWLNMHTIDWFNKVFVNKIVEMNIKTDLIIGNHDTFYKHILTPNSPELLLSECEQITIWSKPGKFTVDDVEFTMIPWICRENEVDCMNEIEKGGDICIGHFEIMGHDMHAGMKNHTGLSPSIFSGFNETWSGHFHTQSKAGNIHYLGTPYQMTWSDFLPKFGFWIFDTHDRSLEFVENKLRYYHRIEWDNGSDYPIDQLEKTYVKLVVKRKDDFESFEKFVDSINFHNPYELKIIESFEEYSSDNVKDLLNVESTGEIIDQYIEDLEVKVDKDKVKMVMKEIYKLAHEVEE